MDEPRRAPTFSEAFRFWLKLGFISFGGPTGQIAVLGAGCLGLIYKLVI